MAETKMPYEGTFDLTVGRSSEMLTQLYQVLFAATAIASPAFQHIEIGIHPGVQRIFVTVRLRWWARWRWPGPQRWYAWLARWRTRWLAQAERNCRAVLPGGYRLLVLYESRGEKHAGE